MSTKAKETPVKYSDLISKSEKDIQVEELALEVQKAKSNLEVTIATTKFDLANAKQALAKTKAAIPYSVNAELSAYREVEALEEGLAFAEGILAERF